MRSAVMCVVQAATSPEIALKESLTLLAIGKEYFWSVFYIFIYLFFIQSHIEHL